MAKKFGRSTPKVTKVSCQLEQSLLSRAMESILMNVVGVCMKVIGNKINAMVLEDKYPAFFELQTKQSKNGLLLYTLVAGSKINGVDTES